MKISLYGGKKYITDDSSSILTVTGGVALVYIVPVIDGRVGRGLLISEVPDGGTIPALCYTDNERVTWRYSIMALDSPVELLFDNDGDVDASRLGFAELSGISNIRLIGYEEAVAEAYRMHQVKDDAFIYQVQKDSTYFYEQGLREIFDDFQHTGRGGNRSETESSLYEAVRYIYGKRNINIVSYEELLNAEGKDFAVEDISRLSNCVTRQVKLRQQWYRKDSGILLGFMKEGDRPVVLEPVGADHYMIIDLLNGMRIRVNSKSVKLLRGFAYQFYRPLSERVVGVREIFSFFIKDMSLGDVIRYIVTAFLGLGVGILLTEVNKLIFDRYIPQRNMSELFQVGGVLFAFTIGNILFGIVKNMAGLRMTARGKYELQAAIYHRTLNLPEQVLKSIDSADIAGRITGFSETCSEMFSMVVMGCVSILNIAVYAGIMMRYSKELALAGIIILGVQVFFLCFFSTKRAALSTRRLAAQGDLSSELYQDLLGIEKIRLSGTENNVLYRYICHFLKVKGFDHAERKLTIATELINLSSGTIFTIFMIFLVSIHIYDFSIGDYMAFASAYGVFCAAVISLTGIYTGFKERLPEWERIQFVLKNEPESAKGNLRPEKVTGRIDIDRVNFAYGKNEKNVLNNISISVSSGEYIGIVGTSGSGKSTLIKLLLGFLTPDMGKIYFDNMDLDTLDKREIRKKMGVVLQNDSLISGSIADNLSITVPGLHQGRMWEILEKVGLKEDVEEMPMGLHTVLDAENPTISGGQKQRLLIARALAGNPKIILFDEATSALDNITQSMVCETLERLDSTRIVIAHRLSTVVHCDRIIVLDRGEIAEEGTYEELMMKNGIFAGMAKRQTV